MTAKRLPRRSVLALASAIGAHLLALLALGWRIPVVRSPPPDNLPPLEITLVRPPARSAPPAAPASPSSSPAKSNPVRPLRPETPTPALSAPVAAPPAPAVAEGPSGVCAPEDLPLLTEAEKGRCRNQIEADKERRLARGADEKAARQVAQAQRMAPAYRMDADKEAYYGAVAAAYDQQSHGPPMAGRHPELHCSAAKPANSLKIGPLPCYVTPPQGFLTEESGIPKPY
jgi:hypothetical protein